MNSWSVVLVALSLTIALAGCGKREPAAPSTAEPKPTAPATITTIQPTDQPEPQGMQVEYVGAAEDEEIVAGETGEMEDIAPEIEEVPLPTEQEVSEEVVGGPSEGELPEVAPPDVIEPMWEAPPSPEPPEPVIEVE